MPCQTLSDGRPTRCLPGVPEAVALEQVDFDTEQVAELLRGDQLLPGAVGEDAAVAHHDDAVDLRQDVGQVVRDHENADALAGDAAQRFAELALSGEIEGVGGLVEEEHLRLVDEGAGNHDAALLAGRHLSDKLGFEMRGLHQVQRLVGAVAHLRRDVEIRPEGGGGEKAGDNGVEAGGDGGAFARELGGDDAEMGAELRDVPAGSAKETQLGGGRDDRVALAGDGFDERRFAAAIGAEDGDVLAAGDAQGDVVEDDIVAAGDVDVAHEEEFG